MSTLESRNRARRKEAEPVTVVGAGPAGLACAIALARAGRRVVVRAWHRDVGARFHGDFQGLENWSDEQDVLDDDRVYGIGDVAVLATGPRRADAIAVGYLFDTNVPDGNWVVFDGRLAPLGYAYLLIHHGRGTLASCMFTGFKRQAEHVDRTVAFFHDRVGLEMQNPRPFGGFANFRLPRTAVQGGHPVVGEQAGFQDALAGFGMRYALRSGLLAAESIVHGTDYASLWRRELLPLLRAGTVNRFVFNLVGEGGWRYALKKLGEGDAGSTLRDRSCDHVDCQCVWCQCQAALKATALT